ncbi:hypothetical protein Tco_0040335 [Tanacetum coccineum]
MKSGDSSFTIQTKSDIQMNLNHPSCKIDVGEDEYPYLSHNLAINTVHLSGRCDQVPRRALSFCVLIMPLGIYDFDVVSRERMDAS